MIVEDVFSDIFLALAVLVTLGSSLGVAAMRDVYQKVHYVTPAALVAPLCVALAIMIQKGWYENTTQTYLALFFMAITGPFLSHATMRAARVRETGDWRIVNPRYEAREVSD